MKPLAWLLCAVGAAQGAGLLCVLGAALPTGSPWAPFVWLNVLIAGVATISLLSVAIEKGRAGDR